MDDVTLPPVPAEFQPKPSRKKALIGGLVALALVAVGGGYAGYRYLDDEKPKGPSYPKEWDPKVEPYAEVAEDLRDLEFKRPVYVDFVPVKEFEKELTADEEDLDDEDREEIEQFTGMLRALGLVHGDVDLFKEANKLSSGGTLAYYSFDDKRIKVRGTKLTPAVKSTLVHELVHVLQDQHFDIGKLKDDLPEHDSGADLALDAVVEGDARRIEADYAESLTPKQRRALAKSEREQNKGAGESIKDVPDVLRTMMGAPYELGEALLELTEDNDDVDDLFENPPTSEEHLVDPWTLIEDDDDPVEVDVPELEDDQEEFDHDIFGSTGWLITLARRIPLRDALQATDGWGGDSYVAYEEDDRSCVQIRYVGDTRSDVREMKSALDRWIAAGPKGTASVEAEDDETLLFTSCDPGDKAVKGNENSAEALGIALTRTYLSAQVLDVGGADFARCYSNGIVQRFTLREIQGDELTSAMERALREIALACR